MFKMYYLVLYNVGQLIKIKSNKIDGIFQHEIVTLTDVIQTIIV